MVDVTVIGGGHQGMTMAAHLSLFNNRVGLWNRTAEHIRHVMEERKIHIHGLYEQSPTIYKVSDDVEEVLSPIIMVTTPATAHKDVARMLARYVDSTYTIVLNPGRTLGALEFVKELKNAGCASLPLVAESQTIIYTCRRDIGNHVYLYAMKKGVQIAAANGNALEAVNKLPAVLRPYYSVAESYLSMTLDNVGMVFHCLPVMMNVGWIENKRIDFKYYYEGITPSVAGLLSKIDSEKASVATSIGVNIESAMSWLKRTYGSEGNSLYECLRNTKAYKDIDAPKTIHHRYLEEDVPHGFVPFESIAQASGVHTPMISLVIDAANNLLDVDFRKTGRKYPELIGFLQEK